MAVPGPVTSAGCPPAATGRRATGPRCVTSAADVLALVDPLGEAPEPATRGTRATDRSDPDARRLWEALPVHGTGLVSDLAAAAGVAARAWVPACRAGHGRPSRHDGTTPGGVNPADAPSQVLASPSRPPDAGRRGWGRRRWSSATERAATAALPGALHRRSGVLRRTSALCPWAVPRTRVRAYRRRRRSPARLCRRPGRHRARRSGHPAAPGLARRAGGQRAARASVARRGAAARAFTAWAARTGRAAGDAGLLLGTPKASRPLPEVLRADEAGQLMDVAAVGADDGSATDLRDRAVLELLYASGLRVGELVRAGRRRRRPGAPHASRARQGRQGAHRAAGPSGPRGAVDAWLARVGRCSSRPPAVRRCCWAPAAAGWGDRAVRALVHRGWRTSPARPTSVRTVCGTPPRPTCWRAARTSGAFRSSSVTLRSQRPRSTRTSLSRG